MFSGITERAQKQESAEAAPVWKKGTWGCSLLNYIITYLFNICQFIDI